jgi:hypothetical protein
MGALAREAFEPLSWRARSGARFAGYRLLLATPRSAAAIREMPAAVPCALSAALGRTFDETAVPRSRARTLACVWMRWASLHIGLVMGAWGGTVGAPMPVGAPTRLLARGPASDRL